MISTALSMSPSASVRAPLQSIIPAPVWSRRALTSLAVKSAIGGGRLRGLGRGLRRVGDQRLIGRRRGVGCLVLGGRRRIGRRAGDVVGLGRRDLGVGA